MHKLLKANFSRLCKEKLFQIFLAAMFLSGALFPILHYIDNRNNDMGWTLDANFFTYGVVAPILLSVLTAFFIGSEYSDGTMRNKLIVGHKRSRIYFANLLTCTAAGVMLGLVYMTAHICIGMPLLGSFETDLTEILLYTGLNLLVLVAFAAIFTLLSMLCGNKAYTVAGCILLTFILLFAGVYFLSALNEPEYYAAYSYTENDVTYEEGETKNPNYLSGTKREIYEFLRDFTPGGQVIQLSNANTEKPGQLALYDGIIFLAATGYGMMVFSRKDLK